MAFQGSKCTTFVTTQAMAEKFLLARGLVLQWYIFIMCKPCKNPLDSISFYKEIVLSQSKHCLDSAWETAILLVDNKIPLNQIEENATPHTTLPH